MGVRLFLWFLPSLLEGRIFFTMVFYNMFSYSVFRHHVS